MSDVIIFSRTGFAIKKEISGSGNVSFRIDPYLISNGYKHPVRYTESAIKVLDWCSEHAGGKHLINQPGKTVLFKDEETAIAFKLTFSE